MRMNVHSLLTFITIVVSLLFFYSLHNIAMAGGALEGCEDLKKQPVPTENDYNLRSFAKVVVDPFSKDEDKRYVIRVNPTHYYLSHETQLWLYFRQCAHIQLKHYSTIRAQNEEPNLREEKDADCWAIEKMLSDEQYHFTERSISKIHRDIEELASSRERWREVFGGPRRQVDTYDCVDKKAR